MSSRCIQWQPIRAAVMAILGTTALGVYGTADELSHQSKHGAQADTTCGAQALQALFGLLGHPKSPMTDMTRDSVRSIEVQTMLELKEIAGRAGLKLYGWHLTLQELAGRHSPAIVHLRRAGGHFVVFLDFADGVVRWIDHGSELRASATDEFAEQFTGYCLLPAQRECQPALRLPVRHFDSGNVRGNTAEHTYVCENVGTQVLRLRVLPCSAQCQAQLMGGAMLQPGTSTQVRIAGAVAGNQGCHAVKIISNDQCQPVQYVSLSYRRQTPISLWPAALHIQVARNLQMHRQIRIQGLAPSALAELRCANPALSFSIDRGPTNEDQIATTIKVSVVSTSPGTFQGDVRLKTTDPRAPILVVPTRVVVLGTIQVRPRSLFWGIVSPGETRERAFTASAGRHTELKIISTHSTAPEVEVGPPARTAAGSFTIPVRLRAPMQPERLVDGYIVLRTNVAGEEEVRIPTCAYVSH